VPETEVAPPQAYRARLLEGVDWAWMLALMAAGLVLRLLYWSGFGLIDDVLFRHFIASSLWNHGVLHDNFTYRFTWWIPTALFGRFMGLSEQSMILPITFAATLGTGVMYALGKQLFGRTGGIIAALLLVTPIDSRGRRYSAATSSSQLLGGLLPAPSRLGRRRPLAAPLGGGELSCCCRTTPRRRRRLYPRLGASAVDEATHRRTHHLPL
jgi:hypothetical protein